VPAIPTSVDPLPADLGVRALGGEAGSVRLWSGASAIRGLEISGLVGDALVYHRNVPRL
jgi:hypothetical protein